MTFQTLNPKCHDQLLTLPVFETELNFMEKNGDFCKNSISLPEKA